MTNEEIIEGMDKGESWEYTNTAIVTHIGNLPAAVNLARQDEGNYKAKYEKAIKIIRRFDAGIIGMYDL